MLKPVAASPHHGHGTLVHYCTVGDHATAVETYDPHSASNEIFMALRRRRGTADDLQGPSCRQALTIYTPLS